MRVEIEDKIILTMSREEANKLYEYVEGTNHDDEELNQWSGCVLDTLDEVK